MNHFDENINKMMVVLDDYNEKWKEFITFLRDESEFKLEYLILLSDNTKNILENMSFTYAKWDGYEVGSSKLKHSGDIACESKKIRFIMNVAKVEEEISEIDIFTSVVEKYTKYNGEEGSKLVRKEIVISSEVPLIKRYMDMFDIVAMCNASDATWR